MFSLARSFAALGTEHFVGELKAELSAIDANLFPLERACQYGGLPDSASVQIVHIGDVMQGETLLVVSVAISFNELRGAACGGTAQTHHHLADCRLTIHRASALAHLALVEAEPTAEF